MSDSVVHCSHIADDNHPNRYNLDTDENQLLNPIIIADEDNYYRVSLIFDDDIYISDRYFTLIDKKKNRYISTYLPISIRCHCPSSTRIFDRRKVSLEFRSIFAVN